MPDTSESKYGYNTLITVGGALMFGGPIADGMLLAKVFSTHAVNAGDFIAVFAIGGFLLAAGLFLRSFSRAQSHIVELQRKAANSIAQIANEFTRKGNGIDTPGQ